MPLITSLTKIISSPWLLDISQLNPKMFSLLCNLSSQNQYETAGNIARSEQTGLFETMGSVACAPSSSATSSSSSFTAVA